MKFGHTLLSHQIPEWQQHYINYKLLKKIVKSIHLREAEIRNTTPNADVFSDSQIKLDLARFFFHLDEDVDKVDDFYSRKYVDYEKRLKKIIGVFPKSASDIHDIAEYDDLFDILLELRNCFRNLKWYAELNRRGFVKILKKLDKKTGTKKKHSYLESKVYPLSFANDSDCVKCLSTINEYLNRLSSVKDSVMNANINVGSDISSSSSISNLELHTLKVSEPQTSKSQPITTPSEHPLRTSPLKNYGLEPYIDYITTDNVDGLESALVQEYMSPVLAPLKLLLSILNKATLSLSFKCIDALLKIIPVLSDSSDVSARNFIHHHIIALGKKDLHKYDDKYNIGQLKKTDYNSSLFKTNGPDGINSNSSSQGLLYIFQNLPDHLKLALLQRDNYKRTPLHYASQYGLKDVTSIIIRFLKDWGMYNSNVSIDDPDYWGDSENLTPLHLSILGKHPLTTSVLVGSMAPETPLKCPYLLHVATRMDTPGLLKCLLSCKGVDINSFENDSTRETALYIASKQCLKNSVKTLLENDADTEIRESSFGWTPIFVAAANGYEEITDLLIEFGADYNTKDDSGWKPREHAALRGHINIISKLTPPNFDPYESLEVNGDLSPKLKPFTHSNNSSSSVLQINRRSRTPEINVDKIDIRQIQPETNSVPYCSSKNNLAVDRTVIGNKYLRKGESTILVTVGTTDLRDETPAIELNKIPLSKIHSTELDSALSIIISASNLPDQPIYPLDLPLDDEHGSSSDPITFKCIGQDPMDTMIYFDIVPTFDASSQDKKRRVLGRGVAFLRNCYTDVGENKRSLINCVKIPILEVSTMEVLGTIKFEVLVVKSFEERGMIPKATENYWKSLVHPRLIGHRGNGMNIRNKKSLQLGENTVESFIAAASLGAQYVEFDVQLTKDDVPVIYHDFTVAESGIDIPMHELTLEQFMHLNLSKENERKKNEKRVKDDSDIYSRSRSISQQSLNGDARKDGKLRDKSDSEESNPSLERMKLTKTWKIKEFKANIRGSSIASSFTTLEELFRKVPKSAGFNIELKYPMLDESQMEGIGQIAPEMNHFLDTILSLVYEKYDGRHVIFSSFHPDICLMMTMKQPSFPVLFLTEAGVNKMADVRASSLQAAIRFAKNWNLFGIVSDAVPFVLCPILASVVKASGLACFTYGTANNDPENARLEIAAGVDAVIVDSVLAVRNELTRFDEIMKATRS
ncbi:hypothetical protein CANINC_004594 [Pichia inconspicua]|uniref:GP-PDE domain-containing protein n=1 Tax=Pichia inconspicua TaxID=52247 RepID=A0A4T0WVR0_9ASCO|nr:hypothetical protein CANINC_004594 [[Candida] inconspicua]